MESTSGCVCYWQRSLPWQSNLVSLDTLLLFFNESALTLTGLTGFQSCSETQPVCMLALMCRIGGPGAHLALGAGTPSSYRVNIP